MGIGRREFVRLTGLALAGLSLDPLQSVAVNQDAYINRKLGVLFYKPRDWGFISVKDFGKLKSKQIIGGGLEETSEEIWNELGDPICVMTKYYEDRPEQKGLFSPTITVNITPKSELAEVDYESFEELIELSGYGISLVLKDFRIIKSYDPYISSGCRFYELDAEYMFEHVEINEPLKVELKVLKAEHNGFYYDFSCHQCKTQNQVADKEFNEFLKTIRMI